MDIITRLKEWGRWSNAFDFGTGFKPIWEAIERHAPKPDIEAPKRKSSKPLITDDEAAMIDKAVSRLHYEHPLLAKVIKKTYISQNSIHEVARYHLTPMEYPEQASLDWNDPNKRKVSDKVAKLMLKVAHDIVEQELKYIESENRKNG